jgi:AraC-like DNA-binding protein
MAHLDKLRPAEKEPITQISFKETGARIPKTRLLRIKDWEQLAQDARYSPEALSALCGISLRQLERFFREFFRKTPRAWLRELQCQRAYHLICLGYSTGAAAESAYFTNASNFCRTFKKVFGKSPQSFSPIVRQQPTVLASESP